MILHLMTQGKYLHPNRVRLTLSNGVMMTRQTYKDLQELTMTMLMTT